MRFFDLVTLAVALLQREGRVTYRGLQREFGLDDALLEDLRAELILARGVAADEGGQVLVWGETPNIAARIQGLAEPNTVVASAATARLTREAFVLEDQRRVSLRGVAEPVEVVRIVGPVDDRVVDGDGAAVSRTPLVGRDEEVGLLLRRWEQSKERLGQVVLVSGEAGRASAWAEG